MNFNKIFKYVSIMAVISLAAVLAGCGGPSGSSTAPKTHMDATGDTAAVYKANCVSCHGSDLQGRIGEATNLQKVGARMNETDIRKQIEEGSPNNGTMKGYKDRLTDEQIAGLAAWLAAKK
ncbi:c-type cytochrome [Paenibacillus sp. NPDC058174]|uniref:c-type cytochrome n=1 Tax=Paenibacillus sp. NPDC058174 TaxID=3346366 RepID=UPI0036D780FA